MRISSCCGCCSLAAGVLIIGGLIIFSSALSIVLLTVEGSGLYALFVLQFIYLAGGGLLIVGVQHRKSKYIFPMLSVYFVILFLFVPFGVVHFIQIGAMYGLSAGTWIGAFLGLVLGVGLLVYILMVLDTFYKELLRAEHTGTRVDGDFNVHMGNKPHFQSA